MEVTKRVADSGKNQLTGDTLTEDSNDENMTKDERMDVILQYMEEHPLALPPTVLYRNLRIYRNLYVTDETVKNYLEEMAEKGWVKRVRKEPLDDGVIEDAGSDDRAYYIITDEGRKHVDELS